MAIRSADLASMTERELSDALVELSKHPAPIESRIRSYELRYELSSNDMRRKVANGEMKETAEIASWLFWLGVRRPRNGSR